MLYCKLSLALSIIKNGSLSFRSTVFVPTTKLNKQLLAVLYKQGYIKGYFMNEKTISVFLKYSGHLKPVIKNLKVLSTPGKRLIVSHKSLTLLKKNSGTLLINTPYGILTLNQALHQYKIGGEVICKII